MMQFELPKDKASIIKVIGVGGGGSNAVNHMYRQGIKGVDFVICNTDQQALDISPVPNKVQLGVTLTEGRGAGSLPEVGKNAAVESLEDLRKILALNTKMVFITAGMGGGTGTGAAPVIAQLAREMGILTVGIVTVPFTFEGRKRELQATEGLETLKKNTDALLVIKNDKLREIYGNLTMRNAFAQADNILTTAARSIAEIITQTYYINVDFNDVHTVMKDSGVAIMGAAVAEGEERALRAAQLALESPLLNDNNIQGARHVLVNVVSGTTEITMDEFEEINEYIQKSAGSTADVIFGNGVDEELGEKVSVTVIATGFKSNSNMGLVKKAPPERVVRSWDQGETQTTDNVNKIVQAITLENRLNEITHKEETQQPVKAEEPDDLGFILKKKPLEEPSQEAQANFEFEVRKAPVDENNEITFDEEAIRNKTQNLRVGKTILPQQDNLEEQFQRARERIMRLKATNNMNDLEKVPAYVRRNVDLDNVPNSAESQISRYTLGEDSEKRPEIRPNNPFLHDNVD